MRGGAIPLLAWATLLLVLFIGNWIVDNRGVNPVVAGFASGLIYVVALMLWLASREAIHRGPPSRPAEPEAVPQASAGAVVAGLSVACILFGLVWAKFLVYFGAGVLALALGRIAVELRTQRMTLRARRGEDRR